ncbi:hypothetical protein ACE6H2_007121 [Prunus campanulata]
MMTVKQIQYNPEAKYIGFHGVLAPGTLENYVKSEGRKTYNSVEEFNDALSRGSKNGGATAVIDEIPYIKSFLAKYSASYSMIKPKPITNGFGFIGPFLGALCGMKAAGELREVYLKVWSGNE